MTLNDILVSALAQLDRGHDAQTLDVWRDKFTRFANDALADLTNAYRPRRRQRLELEEGHLDTQRLEKRCLSVLEVLEDGKALSFLEGGQSGVLRVEGASAPNAAVIVTYRYRPEEMSSPSDEPGLPRECHPLIVSYVVGRERAAGDAATQRGGNVYFQMYEAGKARLAPHVGGQDAYRILNRW